MHSQAVLTWEVLPSGLSECPRDLKSQPEKEKIKFHEKLIFLLKMIKFTLISLLKRVSSCVRTVFILSFLITGKIFYTSGILKGFGKSARIFEHTYFNVSSKLSPPPPLAWEEQISRESFRRFVSFISLVISALKWNPKTSGGATKGS